MEIPLYDSLDGQVALVTGATRGIGKRIADGLVDQGATVYAGARDTADIGNDDREAIELDVTVDANRVAAIDRISEEVGHLDILVNNAGVMDSRESLGEMPTETIEQTLSTNLHGPIHLTKQALDLLLPSPAPASSMSPPGSGRSPSHSPAECRPTGSQRRGSTDSRAILTANTAHRGCSQTRSVPAMFRPI